MVLFRRLAIAASFVSVVRIGFVRGYAVNDVLNNEQQQVLGAKNIVNAAVGAWKEQQSKDLESWLSSQRELSFTYLLANIAPNGNNTRDSDPAVSPGAVLASPSRSEPDYFYQWVRDAAITIGNLVDEFHRKPSSQNRDLKSAIDAYANLQWTLQTTVNPSGDYNTGGLGEPKFLVDATPFLGSWGRPQRDGPALRALTLMKYIRTLRNASEDIDAEWLRGMYDGAFPTRSVIKADLEYVAHTWSLPGFDLWEEVEDRHFFTALVQHRALVEGRDFADMMNDAGAAEWYDKQQMSLWQTLLPRFWSQEKGHIVAMLNTPERVGIDCGNLLGGLHGGHHDVFSPWSDEMLATLQKMVDDMAKRHPVNRNRNGTQGVGIGRYPEDVYDGVGFTGGNPWFLCTSTVSSIIYKTVAQYLTQGYFEITETNTKFFTTFHPSPTLGRYTPSSGPEFRSYLTSMFSYADSFLEVIRNHTTSEGRLSEQFHRITGHQEGARDLTWSYGSFIGATDDREVAKLKINGVEWK